jgi:hypothetical protein
MRENRYNKKAWHTFLGRLEERKSYQVRIKKGHKRKKMEYIATGGGKNVPPFSEKPDYNRAKSAPPGFGGSLEEEITDKDLETLKFKDALSDSIWATDDEVKPSVRDQLLQIAKDFLDGLEIKIPVEDIRLTGSLANYNWHGGSDIDLHIITDFSQLDDSKMVLESLFRALTAAWNAKHDITIEGHDVEIYVEDKFDKHYSTGVYSLEDEAWVKKPTKEVKFPDLDTVRKKADHYIERIDAIQDAFDEADYDEAHDEAGKLKKKLKKARQQSLKKGGELGVENLMFKVLRRTGEIERLYDLSRKAYDMSMTI